MPLLLGVDGGNTKTIALLARSDGTIAGWGRSGNSDLYGAGSPDLALAAIEAAAEGALHAAGATRLDLTAAAFTLAGADWPEDITLLRRELAARGWGREPVVVNDAIGPLHAGSADGPAVAVTCGTALAIGARGKDGRLWHGSWWLEGLGGTTIAEAALRAVYRSALGIEPPTALTEPVLTYFGASSVEEVLHARTARGRPRRSLAGLPPLVLAAAEMGDPAAGHIIVQHGDRIGDYAAAAARQVDILDDPFPLILAGGVLRHSASLLREAITVRVRRDAPGVTPVPCPFEPCVGALLLAFDAVGVPVMDEVLARMVATGPAADLYATISIVP